MKVRVPQTIGADPHVSFVLIRPIRSRRSPGQKAKALNQSEIELLLVDVLVAVDVD